MDLFRTQSYRRTVFGLAISGVALVVACGSSTDSTTNNASSGAGGEPMTQAGASASGAKNQSTAGSSGAVGHTGGGTGSAGEPAAGESGSSEGGASEAGASGSSEKGGSGGATNGAGASGKAGSGGAQNAAGSGGSGGSLNAGGSGGAVTSGGAAGAVDAAGAENEGGAAGAGDCTGLHGCVEPNILATVTSPYAIALDSTYVYWTTLAATSTVQRAPIATGPVETIVSGEKNAGDLAVAGANVFWSLNDANPGHLAQASVTGGSRIELATAIATTVPPAPSLTSVSSDGAFVYYVTNFNQVGKVPVGVVDSTPGYVSYGPYNSNIIDMVLFGGVLYYTNNGIWNSNYTAKLAGTATIRQVNPATDTTSTSLVTQLNYPLFRIAVDGTNIFWNDDTHIYSTSMIGGLPNPVIAVDPVTGGASPVADMVSDGTNLYYADAHNVYRIPVAGGPRQRVSWGWQSIGRMAIDANHVYFTDYGGGSVVEIAK
jgi:hypothetical protein